MAGLENFGGSSNVASVFGSLLNEETSRMKTAVENQVTRAQQDQNEKDTVMQENWKAGRITSAQWLAYIKQRIADTAEYPDQQTVWKQFLIQNQNAITDATYEGNYAMGKISLGALIDYYKNRIGGSSAGSPDWTTLTSRYAQLINARASGGGGGGGGGGGSSVGGGNFAEQAAASTKATEAGHPGQTEFGARTSPNVDDRMLFGTNGPTVMGYLMGAQTYTAKGKASGDDALTRTIKALADNNDELMQYRKWFKDHPQDTSINLGWGTITRSQIPGMDKQYFRNMDALNAYRATGKLNDTQMSTVNTAINDHPDYLKLMQNSNESQVMGAMGSIYTALGAGIQLANGDVVRENGAYRQAAAALQNLIEAGGNVSAGNPTGDTRYGAAGSPGQATRSAQLGISPQLQEFLTNYKVILDAHANPELYSGGANEEELLNAIGFVNDIRAKIQSPAFAGALGTDNPDVLNMVSRGETSSIIADTIAGLNATAGWDLAKRIQAGTQDPTELVNTLTVGAGGVVSAKQIAAQNAVVVPVWDGDAGHVAWKPGAVSPSPAGDGTLVVKPDSRYVAGTTHTGVVMVNGVPTQVQVTTHVDPAAPFYYVAKGNLSWTVNGVKHVYEKGQAIATADVQSMLDAPGKGIAYVNGALSRESTAEVAVAGDGTKMYYDNQLHGWSSVAPSATNQTDTLKLGGGETVQVVRVVGGVVAGYGGAGSNSWKTQISTSRTPGLQVVPYFVGRGVNLSSVDEFWRSDVANGRVDDNTFNQTDANGNVVKMTVGEMAGHVNNWTHWAGGGAQDASDLADIHRERTARFVATHGGDGLASFVALHSQPAPVVPPTAAQNLDNGIRGGAAALGINLSQDVVSPPTGLTQAGPKTAAPAPVSPQLDALQAITNRKRLIAKPNLLDMAAPVVKYAPLPTPKPAVQNADQNPLSLLPTTSPSTPPGVPVPTTTVAGTPNYSGKMKNL